MCVDKAYGESSASNSDEDEGVGEAALRFRDFFVDVFMFVVIDGDG